MRKLFTPILFCIPFAVSAQNLIVPLREESPNFNGLIDPKSHIPTGEMAATLPHDKLKENCLFFGGDTLDGFDFEKYSGQTVTDGCKLLLEYKNSMRNFQIEFVKNKFGLTKITKFEKESTYKMPELRSVLTSGCNNIDFEDGDLNGWTVSSGINKNSNAALTIMGVGNISTNGNIYSCNDVNLINGLYGTDAIGLSGLDPLGGSTSVRLGGYFNVSKAAGASCAGILWSGTYSNGEMISKAVTVTAANALMAYDYEVVINDGGHSNGHQPYFHVFITNLSGTVLSTCTEYYVQGVAGSPPVGFVNSGFINTRDNSVVYKKAWTSNSINLTPYIGQSVVVSFVAAGCTAGGHFSYAYVDAMCGPVDVIASNNTPCSGTNVTLTAPSVQNGTYSWSGPGISGSTTNQTATVTSSGTYTVIVTPSQGSACSYSITKVITFKPIPSLSLTAVPNVCAGSTLALNPGLSGGSGTYSSTVWTGAGAGSLTSTTISNPGFINLIAGSYPLTLTVTDDQGCIGTANTIITVNGNPSATISPNSPSTCTGVAVAINGVSTGGSGIYTSNLWTGAGAISLSATNISNPNFTNSIVGAYPLTFTVTDSNGCTDTANTIMNVNLTPATTITASGTTTFCQGGTITLDAGAGFTSYLWSDGSTTQTIPVSNSGTYSVNLTAIGGCSDTAAASTLVIVNPNPIPVITPGGATTFCGGGNVSLDAGAGYSTYFWSNEVTSQTTVIGGTGNYTVTVTDTNGCTGSSAIGTIITVNPNPSPTITSGSPTTLCADDNVILDAGAGYSAYAWSNEVTSQTTIVASSGSYSVTVTDSNGCSGSSATSMIITVNPNPTPKIIAEPTTFCSGDTLTLDAGAGYSSYSWSNEVSSQTTIVTSSGNYNYSVIVVDSNGCSGSADTSITVTVNPTPAPVITASDTTTFCSGGSVTLDAGTGYAAYTWNSGATSQTLTISNSGNYSVTVTDSNGCIGATVLSTTVTVNPNPTPTISSSGATTFCAGATITLDAGAGYTSYSWNNEATTQTVSVGNTGTWSVTVTDNNGCTGSSAITTLVPPLPVADTSNLIVTPAYCGGNTGSITGITMTSGQAPFTYTWYDASGSIVGNGNTDLPTISNGEYTVTITDSNNCSITAGTFTVTSDPAVIAAFTADTVKGETPFTVHFTNESTGASNYLWQYGTGDTSTIVSPAYIYIPLGNFNVCLIASTINGCADTACSTIDVYINSVFIIPNIFTPNNDNINDIFSIHGKGIKTLNAEVYDRWGLKLYEWVTPNGGWDGYTASGVNASDGTYYYIINATGFDNKKYFEKGTFSLIRGNKQ